MALEVSWARALEGADAEAFDRFVLEARSGHYAQSRAWAPVVRAARPCAMRYVIVREQGRVVGTALVGRASVGALPLPFAAIERGPVSAAPEEAGRVALAIARAARRRGVARLTVMPYWADAEAERAARGLRQAGFVDVQAPEGAHASTLRLEITNKTDEALFAGRALGQVRWRKQQAERAGATSRAGTREDFAEHRRLSAQMLAAQGKRDRPAAWYEALWTAMLEGRERGALFVGEHEGRIVGTAVVLRHGPIAVYAYGATRSEPAPFTKSILPLVQAVRWARDQGCRVFDLGGIPSPGDRDPKRVAIAKLKLDFSNVPVALVGEHARWL